MYSKPLPPGEFHRLHKAHIASAWWKDFRRRFLEYAGYRCSVCGFDYLEHGYSKWQLITDHKLYWKNGKIIFGHETFDNVRCVCPGCNRKGVRSDATVRSDRKAYWYFKALLWVSVLPFRLIRGIVRLVSRRVRS